MGEIDRKAVKRLTAAERDACQLGVSIAPPPTQKCCRKDEWRGPEVRTRGLLNRGVAINIVLS